MIYAALWDLDGTLIDSMETHFDCWREAFANEGFDLTREKFGKTYGIRAETLLRMMLGDDLPAAEIDRIMHAKEEKYRVGVRAGGASLLPGAKEWLERLADAGWQQAIVTSAPRANADVVVEYLSIARFFGTIVAAEDVRLGKPDPEPFLLGAERLGATPSTSVVVEDAPAGLDAARAAGMASIGVLTSHESLDATVVVPRLTDLPLDAFDRLTQK